MTRRAVYRETTENSITLNEFKNIADGVTTWASGSPNRSAPTVRLNADTMRAEVEIQIQGISKSQLNAKLDALDTAAAQLAGTWPAPSENTHFVNE